jgi:profilin
MCSLPGGGQLSSAAIVGHDGGVWAQSAGFPAISKTEVDALLAGLADPAKLAMTGIVIGGEKARAPAPPRAPAAARRAPGCQCTTECSASKRVRSG